MHLLTPHPQRLPLSQASRASVAPIQLAQSFGQSSGSFSGRGQGWSGYSIILFKIPVASMSNNLRIACKITLCVTRGCCVWFVIFCVVHCQIIYCICQLVLVIYLLTSKYRVCIIFLCIGRMDECINSDIIETRYLFFFYDFMHCFSNILVI